MVAVVKNFSAQILPEYSGAVDMLNNSLDFSSIVVIPSSQWISPLLSSVRTFCTLAAAVSLTEGSWLLQERHFANTSSTNFLPFLALRYNLDGIFSEHLGLLLLHFNVSLSARLGLHNHAVSLPINHN